MAQPIDAYFAPWRAYESGASNMSDLLMQAERMKTMRADRERDAWKWQQDQAEATRESNARTSMADLVLAQSPTGPTPTDYKHSTVNPLPEGFAEQSDAHRNSSAWADYVRYDPEGALDFRQTTIDWNNDQFELASKLNQGVLQILSGVYDEQSFNRGKNKARALYARYGLRLDDLDLPEEYSPELIRSLQMEAMDTRHQLETVRRERELDWDIEDDQIDNERADRNTESLISDRDARRAETRRYHDARTATTRRGQDLTDARGRRGQDMRGGGKGSGGSGPIKVKSRAEAMKLPPGTEFRTPDGRVMRVPAR